MSAADFAMDVPGINLSPRAKLEILFATLLALFLVALDQTIVGVALPKIVTDLNGNSLYTWAITIYLLTSTISGPVYGKLSDLFGRRPIILFAISLFIVASVLAALSQEMWQFVAARGLQGLGAGAIFPVAFATLADLYTPAERGKYAGYFGAVFGLSSILGPAVGGIITDNFGWHWIFLINVPIGLISFFMIYRLLPTFRSAYATRTIDYVGVALFTATIAPFMVGLSNKQNPSLAWTDPWVGGLILVGLVFGVLFLIWERRFSEPLIPLHLFRIRTFSISVTAMFLAAFGFFAAIVFLPRWFQVVAGASATESGYNLLPLLAALIISATLSGQIVARTHRYKLLVIGSMVTLAVGLYLLTNLHANTDRPVLWIWMIIAGLGIGPSFAVFTLIVQNAVPPREIGTASSSLTFFQQIGGTVGLTIASTLFASKLIDEIPGQMAAAGVPQQLIDGFQQQGASLDLTGTGDLGQRILSSIPPEAQAFVAPFINQIVAGIHEAFSLAVGSTMWLGIAGALIAAVVVLFLKEVPLRSTFEMPEASEAAGDAGDAASASGEGAAAGA